MSKLEVEVPLAKAGEEKQPDSDAELSEDVLSYREKRYTTIKWLHFWAFVFFLVQTVIYSAIKPDIAVNPSVGFPEPCDGPICSPGLKGLGNTNPIWTMAFFCALACFDHFVCFVYMNVYVESTKYWLFQVGSNPFRWIEYSVSASVMAVAIAILSGVHDVHLWFLIFVGHAIGMLLGMVIEFLPKTDSSADPNVMIRFDTLRKFVYGLSAASIFTPWLVILCYFFASVKRSPDGVPDFVYAAFLGTLVLFITFGINGFCHNILKKYDFPTAEIVYIVLSFTAKTFLAADVFGGLNAAEDNDTPE